MKLRFQILFLAGTFLAVMFLSVPAQIQAALPEGVKVEVIAEYPSEAAGIEIVRLVKFTFQPGAIIKNLPVKDTGY